MKRKGFIFTMDAVLTLLPLFIAIASLSNMGAIDTTGSLHHLVMGRRAQDILAVQEINGSLLEISTIYQRGLNTTNQTLIDQAASMLSGVMEDTVPSHYGYNATMVTPFGDLSVSRGNSTDNRIVAVKSVVGPALGWVGKALFKNDSVDFKSIPLDVVRNVYNFDNNRHDDNYGNATFYLPDDVTVNGCLYGAETHMYESNSPSGSIPPADLNENLSSSYQFTPYINGYQAGPTINGSEFKYIGYWNEGGAADDAPFYATNRDGDGTLWCNASLITPGENNFTWIDNDGNFWQNSMTLLVNFTTQILMPRFTNHSIIYLPDSAGNEKIYVCSPIDDLSDDPDDYNDSSCADTWASVIWSEKTINIPNGTYVKDATLHLNIGGAADATVVYVQNSSGWTKIFDSDEDFGGWSNRVMPPSVLDLRESITTGDNTIKVLLWDSAESQASYEYEIIKNSYIELITTEEPLRLGVYNAENTGDTATTATQTFTFTAEVDSTKAYFFPGVSISTSHIKVELDNGSGYQSVYDDDPVPEYVELSPYINQSEDFLTPGTYSVRVTITKATRYGMKYNGIFSGTRVIVTYAQIYGYTWSESYEASQESAEQEARQILSDKLALVGENVSWDSSEIQASSSYASAYPVTSYMVLTIWEES